MSNRLKKIFAALILLFAGITLGLQVRKEFQTVDAFQLSEGVNVVCTHATVRCPTCLSIERLTREALAEHHQNSSESAEKIAFHTANYESPQFADMAEQHKIATATVLLVKVENSEIVSSVVLTNEAWKLYTDATAFKTMLKERIDAFIQDRPQSCDDPTTEIVFEEGTVGESNSESDTTPYFLLSDEELDRKLGLENTANNAAPRDYVWVVYFYHLPECESCRIMSEAVFEILQTRFAAEVRTGQVVLRYRNFEDDSNAALVGKLKIESPSLAVLQMKDGKPVKAKLAGKIWSLLAAPAELSEYVCEIIQGYR